MTGVSSDSTAGITAQAQLTLENLAGNPLAVGLVKVLAFMAADDIPRWMLQTRDAQLAHEAGDWAGNPRSQLLAIDALMAEMPLMFDGQGIYMHRARQLAVIDVLSPEDRARHCRLAAQLVLEAMPDTRLVGEWAWAARVVRHAIVVARHLDTLRIEPLLHTRLRREIGRFQLSQGQLEGARDNLHHALTVVEEADRDSALHGRILCTLGDAYRQLGRFTRALELFKTAYDLHIRILTADHSRSSPGGSHNQAISAQTAQVVQSAQSVSPQAALDPDVAADLRLLGLIERDRGNTAEALSALQESGEIFAQKLGPESVDCLEIAELLFSVLLDHDRASAIDVLRNLRDQKMRIGGYDDDVEEYGLLLALLGGDVPTVEDGREVTTFYRNRYGPHHPNTADGLVLLGVVLSISNSHDALEAFQQGLEIHLANFGEHHHSVASSRVCLIRHFLLASAFEEAEQQAEQVLEIVRTTPEVDRADVLRLTRLPTAVAEMGGVPEQRPFLDVMRTVIREHSVDDETTATLNGALSRAYRMSGDHLLVTGTATAAQAEYEQALALAHLTPDPLDDFEAETRLGYMAALRDETENALGHWRTSLALFRPGAESNKWVWFLVRVFGQLCQAVSPTATGEAVLRQLIDELQEAGDVTQFRARITSLVPDGWSTKESITLVSPDGQANVIASSEPLNPPLDTVEYATIQGTMLQDNPDEFPGYVQAWETTREVLGGRPGIMRCFTWNPPHSAPVTQLQLYYAEGARGYTATATTPATNFESVEQMLITALLSLRIASD